MDDLFAAMPPAELVKMLLVKAAQHQKKEKPRKVMLVDISKAHLYAPAGEGVDAYVDLPPECSKPGKRGKLNYWLCGVRPASRGWENQYTD